MLFPRCFILTFGSSHRPSTFCRGSHQRSRYHQEPSSRKGPLVFTQTNQFVGGSSLDERQTTARASRASVHGNNVLFPAATGPDEAHKKSRGIFPPQACPLDTVARPPIESNNLQGTKATQSTSTIYYGPDLPRPQMTLYAPKGRSLPPEKISATLKPGPHKRWGKADLFNVLL